MLTSATGSSRCHVARLPQHWQALALRPRTRPVARARPVTQLPGLQRVTEEEEERSASPSGSSALGTSIEYRMKKNGSSSSSSPSPVMDFMSKLQLAWQIFFPERPPELSAKEQGKQRLRMILVADRCGLSPVGLTEMKKNILRSIENYVDIESEEQIEVSITLEPEVGTVYSVAVPIRRVKPEARMAWEGEENLEEVTFEYDPDDFDSDPTNRFPYGT